MALDTRSFLLLALLVPALALAQAPAPAPEASTPEYLEMQARSAPYRAFADRWIALARTGDVAALERTISPNMIGKVGADTVRRSLDTKVAPFFTQTREVGKSTTVAQTTDAFGSTGYVYYMYMMAKTGELRPFALYVVEENGKMVVANILTDYAAPNRHK
jgi:hypothetical protein